MLQNTAIHDATRRLFPTSTIALLLAIGFIDLVATAVLHSQGLIVELNPFMKVFIEQSEWLFAFVKGLTLVSAWFAMVAYHKVNPTFVRKAAGLGSGLYVAIWVLWFMFGRP